MLMFVIASPMCQAELITTFDFTGAPGNQASTPGTATNSAAGHLTVGNIARGPGVTASAATNSISSTGWSMGALDLNDYYGFTLTPNAGDSLNVDQIVFSERRSLTGIRNISIRSSLDGFTSDLFSVVVPDVDTTRRQTANFGSAFDALTTGVTFRFYGFTAEAAGGTWRIGNQTSDNQTTLPPNLIVNGSVSAVPEPS